MDNEDLEYPGLFLFAPFIGFAGWVAALMPYVLVFALAKGMGIALSSLPTWAITITAGTLVTGLIACAIGRLEGAHLAPSVALGLSVVLGLIEMERGWFESFESPSAQTGDQVTDAIHQMASTLVVATPWILALAVTVLSLMKIIECVTIVKARRSGEGAIGDSNSMRRGFGPQSVFNGGRTHKKRRNNQEPAYQSAPSGDGDFATSMAVAMVTDSAATGYAGGGSITGAIVGAEMASSSVDCGSSSQQ